MARPANTTSFDALMNYDDPVADEWTRQFDPHAPRDVVDDAFELEFNEHVINNPSFKNRYRLSPDERAQIMWFLSITREQYLAEHKQLPDKETKSKHSSLYHRATTEFEIGGPFPYTSLMRRAETINPKSKHPLNLGERRVIMGDAVYHEINQVHKQLLHAGRDKTWNEIQATCYGITREEVEWFTSHCKYCITHRPTATKGALQPLMTSEVGDRVQWDLVDMRAEPSGIYKWVMHSQDHKSRFMTLWPLVDKSAPVVANAVSYWLMAGHQMKIWQSDNGGEFKGALNILVRRHGIKIIHGRPRHPQSQGMNEQANGHIRKRIAAWKATTGCKNWDIALAEIAQVHNHTMHSAIKMKPFEMHFNAKSHWVGNHVEFQYFQYLRVESEDQNTPDTPDAIARQAIARARARGEAFDPFQEGVQQGQHLQSLPPVTPSSMINNPPESQLRFYDDPVINEDDEVMTDGIASGEEDDEDEPGITITPCPPAREPTPPTQRLSVLRGKASSDKARDRMLLRHNRGKRVHHFEKGDVTTLKIPAKDHPGKGAPPRLFAIIAEVKHRGYILQTKAGILNHTYPANALGVVNQDLAHIYAAEIHAANKITKVSLRLAAREGHVGPAYITCNCRTMPCGNRCRCKRLGVKCTIYCHGRQELDCPNNAVGTAYHQKALINVGDGEQEA